jgi:hypothetical protein
MLPGLLGIFARSAAFTLTAAYPQIASVPRRMLLTEESGHFRSYTQTGGLDYRSRRRCCFEQAGNVACLNEEGAR